MQSRRICPAGKSLVEPFASPSRCLGFLETALRAPLGVVAQLRSGRAAAGSSGGGGGQRHLPVPAGTCGAARILSPPGPGARVGGRTLRCSRAQGFPGGLPLVKEGCRKKNGRGGDKESPAEHPPPKP